MRSLKSIRLMRPHSILVAVLLIFVPLYSADKQQVVSKLLAVGCDVEYYYSLHGFGSSIYCNNKGLTSVPKALPNDLFELQLPNNALTTFPCIAFPYMIKLNLKNNSIAHFPWKCLKNMPKLGELDLSHNQLSCVSLFPVKSFLPNLRRVDLSYNRLKTVLLCDLGVDWTAADNGARYTPILGGNPFHCSCHIGWLMDIGVIVKQCSIAPSVQCDHFFARNSIFYEFKKDQSLFRCKTPSKLEDAEFYRLNLTSCSIKNGTGPKKLVVPQGPCSLDHFCPMGEREFPMSSVVTLSVSWELFLQTTEQTPKQDKLHYASPTVRDLLNGTGVTLSATRSFRYKTATSSLLKQTVQKGDSVQYMSITDTPQATSKSSPQPVAVASERMLTTWSVGVSLVCVLLLAVYSVLVRKQPDKHASLGDVNNMAPGHVVNHQANINEIENAQVGNEEGCSNEEEGCSNDPIPDSDYSMQEAAADIIELYGESTVFEVPQYSMEGVNIGTTENFNGKKAVGSVTGQIESANDCEHIYHNAEVSDHDGISPNVGDTVSSDIDD